MKTDDAWQVIADAIATRADENDRTLLTSAAAGLQSVDVDYAPLPDFSDAELDAALSAAARLRVGDDAADGARPHLAALPPDHAGRLVTQLLETGRLATLAWVSVSVPPHRFPVRHLLLAALKAPGDQRRDLLRAAALAPTVAVISGVADLVEAGEAPAADLAGVVEGVAAIRRAIRDTGDPYRWWDEPRAAPPQPSHRWHATGWPWPPPPAHAGPPAPRAPTPAGADPSLPGADPSPPGADPSLPGADPSPPGADPSPPAAEAPRREAEPPPVGAELPSDIDEGGDVLRGPGEAQRTAYPRLQVATGTDRPDVVVLDQPFEVSVGLQPRRDPHVVSSSPIPFVSGEVVELEVVLLYDPASIEVTGSPRGSITVSDADPFPALTFTCVARWVDRVERRRLGIQLLRDGQVVGVAWRTVTAVDSVADVAGAEAPPDREVELLELDPLLGDDPPDLIVSVCRADVASPTFVWTAYAADPTVAVPDLPSTTTLEDDVAGFALEARRSIQFSADPSLDYLGLAGRAIRIGRAVPEAIQAAIRQVVEAPERAVAPAILLLTEELHVPWELATFATPLTDAWGGDSPFLGAHAAISRWPLTEHRPRPRPLPTVAVRSAAVLTADYQGVPGWGRLESAVAEAAEVATLFTPEAQRIEPDLWTVMSLFRGTPEADVVHVALHGQYDAQGDQEGLVLLTKSPAGGSVAQFLSPTVLESGQLAHGPFVFLNACQVGTDERVLGDYGGFASTLLRIGATGVVAPLWNVKDDVAAEVARRFYAATLSALEPVSAAEAMRAVRATYTEDGVRTGQAGLHATLVAYQVFGHPRLTLTR